MRTLREMKCQVCDYQWVTKSEHKLVSCPSCLSKVKNIEKIKEVEQREKDRNNRIGEGNPNIFSE